MPTPDIADALEPCYTASAFSQLPFEIVAKIIHFVLPLLPGAFHVISKDYYTTLNLLARVSKGWRDVILGSPGLWRGIDASTPPGIWSAALEHSKSSPIVVSMMWDDPRFWEKVWAHVGRWESVTICSRAVVLHLDKTEINAPKLKVCTISIDQYRLESVVIDLRTKMAPKLEVLTLVGTKLRSWDCTLLARLRGLHLRRITMSRQELMLTLHECKALERLSLDRLEFSDWNAPLPEHPPPIVLASLSGFYIENIGSVMVAALLGVLETPRCTSFLFEETSRWADDTAIAACINYITPAATLALTSPARIEFVCDCYKLKLRVHCDDCTWQFMLADRTSSKLINWVLDTFKDALIRTSTDIKFISLEGDWAYRVSDSRFFHSLPRVETIRTDSQIRTEIAILISALSQRQRGGEWDGRWLFPRLRHLHIDGDHFGAKALTKMLRNRRHSAGAVNALEIVELSNGRMLSTKAFRKIEQIAGPHVLRLSKAEDECVRLARLFDEAAY